MVHTFKQFVIQNVQNQLTLKMSRIKALNLKLKNALKIKNDFYGRSII